MGKRYNPGQVSPSLKSGGGIAPSRPSLLNNVSANDFGAYEAEQIGNFGQDIQRAARVVSTIQEDADRVKVSRLYSSAHDEMSAVVRDMQIKSARGDADSIDIVGQTTAKFKEIEDKYLGNFDGNDESKNLFATSFYSERNKHLDGLSQQQVKNILTQDQVTADIRKKDLTEMAITWKNKPEIVADSELKITADTLKQFANAPESLRNEKAQQAINDFHAAIANAYAVESPTAALQYIEANKGKFDPVLLEGDKGLIAEYKKAAIEEQALDIARNVSSSRLPLDKQLEKIDSIKDPKLANRARDLVKERFNEQQTINNLAYEDYKNTQFDALAADPANYVMPNIGLKETDRRQFEEYQRMRLKEKAGGLTTNREVYSRLMGMSNEEFKKVNLLDYNKDLAEAEFKELTRMQRGIREGKGASDDIKVRTLYTQAQDALKGLSDFNNQKISSGSKQYTEKSAKLRKQFFEQFQSRLDVLDAEQRKNEAEVGKIINDLLSPVDPGLFSRNKYRFQMSYEEDLEEKQQLLSEPANVPENLKVYGNAKYDVDADQYYVDGNDGVRRVYDRYGRYLMSGRKAE